MALQYLDGRWRPGSGSWDLVDFDPYTGEKLATVTVATAAEVDAAYRAAARTQREWAAAGVEERRGVFTAVAALLTELYGTLTDLLVSETGCTLTEAHAELRAAARLLDEAGELAQAPHPRPAASAPHHTRVEREPVGVVGVITPAERPFTAALRMVCCALALGDGVVLKPHQSTPVCGGTLPAALFAAAGLPAGLLSVVVTDVAEIGDAFLEHPVPRTIAFTGSAAAGRRIAATAAARLKRPVLELDGSSSCLVLDDADLALAVEETVRGAFLQRGGNTPRVFVQRSVAREFTGKLVHRVRDLRVGDPRDPHTELGPLVDTSRAEAVAACTAQARRAGAEPLVTGHASGCLVHPTVLTASTGELPLFRRGLPRPLLALLPFDDDAEAAALAAAAAHVTAGTVHTADASRGVEVARRSGLAECRVWTPGAGEQADAGAAPEALLDETLVAQLSTQRRISVVGRG